MSDLHRANTSPDQLVLEPAEESDHPAVVALVNRAYRGQDRGAVSWNVETGLVEGERTTLELLRADLAGKPHARLLVYRDPEAGLLANVWLEPLGAGVWHLGLLAVSPDRQDGGLGRRMLEACEAFVRAEGGTRVAMSVLSAREALIAWYERRGYGRTGETEPFPYGDDRFGRPLKQDLRFVHLDKALT